MRRVESIAGFPNVVGAIDGSHITIKAPQVNREDYFNGKQNYSINLQGVVDAADKFIDVSTGWPGSIHDARISRLSTLYLRTGNNLILTEPVKRFNEVAVRPLLICLPLTTLAGCRNFFWDHFLKELRYQAQLGNQAF